MLANSIIIMSDNYKYSLTCKALHDRGQSVFPFPINFLTY